MGGEQMIDQLVGKLTSLGQTVATAESVTGGLVAATIVDVPGSSNVFTGGLIVYATELKHTLGGVDADLLATEGTVSPHVAVALARGARLRCRADWGVATTGVAGPDSPDDVPVGTVFVAISGPTEAVRELHLTGDRSQIRRQAVTEALHLLAVNL
jgi:nicotinamide-nucleotide amidase